jgi:hypothetical protein
MNHNAIAAGRHDDTQGREPIENGQAASDSGGGGVVGLWRRMAGCVKVVARPLSFEDLKPVVVLRRVAARDVVRLQRAGEGRSRDVVRQPAGWGRRRRNKEPVGAKPSRG